MSTSRAALVRAVSPRLADAELTHLDRTPADVDRAVVQHTAYRQVLRALGLDVVVAPPAPDHPDAVFVEDALVVVDDLGILTRPGARSRRGEVEGLAPLLADRGLRQAALTAPGTLDGGDVLQVGRTVFVGRSSRTDEAGIRQLRTLVGPLGRALDTTPFAPGAVLEVAEPAGANVLLVGETVVVSASAPRTAAMLAARGWDVRTVEVDEFELVEAGPTCLSVLLP